MASVNQLRDTDNLYALPETVACVLQGCVPCCYKLLVQAPTELDGDTLNPKCHKNIRPELCLRIVKTKKQTQEEEEEEGQTAENSGEIAKCGLYSSNDRILIVGDGDFTFSLALAKSFRGKTLPKLVCTSFQSRTEVESIYKDGKNTLKQLETEYGFTKVFHNVDATRLEETLLPKLTESKEASKFTKIVFNFPCIPDDIGRDGQSTELDQNKLLVSSFITSASKLLDDGDDGEIHVVHKTKEPFNWWKIPELAPEESNCEFFRSIVFDRSIYPSYIPRKVGENKSFPVFDAVTYCFRPKKKGEEVDQDDEPASSLMTPEMTKEGKLVKLSEKRLLQVVSLLQLAAIGGISTASGKRGRKEFTTKTRDSKKLRKRQKQRKKKA